MARTLDPSTIAKGAAALALYRKEKAAAKEQGSEAYQKWQAEATLKKAQKKTSPMEAIANFCMHCVGSRREDITNCTATKCPLYIYRPYQP